MRRRATTGGRRARRRFRLPWWVWGILGLYVLSRLVLSSNADPDATTDLPRPSLEATEPVVSPDPLPTPTPTTPAFTEATAILNLGQRPAIQDPAETSREGNRVYYTWNRPDLGEQVNTVWIAPDDWWVKIGGVNFDYHALGALRGDRFTEGPLSGLVMNSRVPDRVLHIMSEKWAARLGQTP